MSMASNARSRLQPARGLSDVALKAGIGEPEYASRMMLILSTGDVMDLLSIRAQVALFKWVNHRRLEDTGSPFVVMLRLSEGRRHDPALFCMCRVDMSGDDDALVRCDRSVPGFADAIPSMASGMDLFEAGLSDLETEVKS
jgi:hypothetical protein